MIAEYLKQIQLDGLTITTVYDIGACEGNWSFPLKQSVLKDSYFYLFEANEFRRAALDSAGLPYYIGVLSNPGRDYVEFFSKATTGDSYYCENTAHYDDKQSVQVPCRTLESIVAEADLPIPNLLKIDTQGSELDILRGAESILDQVDLVFLECPIICYNLGAPNLQDYLDFMKEHGFVPTEVLEIHKSEHTVLQIDIMFINDKTKTRLYGPNKYIRP
jgi:FkbM family methyltransferase